MMDFVFGKWVNELEPKVRNPKLKSRSRQLAKDASTAHREGGRSWTSRLGTQEAQEAEQKGKGSVPCNYPHLVVQAAPLSHSILQLSSFNSV